MSNLVFVRSYRTRAEAEWAAASLEAAGIRVIVKVDDAGGSHPELVFTTSGAKLLVTPTDAERARELLDT